jgi:hypothetical protein
MSEAYPEKQLNLHSITNIRLGFKKIDKKKQSSLFCPFVRNKEKSFKTLPLGVIVINSSLSLTLKTKKLEC